MLSCLTTNPFERAIVNIPDGSRLYHWTKGLIKIKTSCLMESLCHEFGIVPLGLSLILNTQLHPIAFNGRETKDHVPFLCKANNSFLIVAFECSCCKASCIEVCSRFASMSAERDYRTVCWLIISGREPGLWFR